MISLEDDDVEVAGEGRIVFPFHVERSDGGRGSVMREAGAGKGMLGERGKEERNHWGGWR